MHRRAPVALTLPASLAMLTLLATAPARAVNDPGFDRQWGMRIIGAPAAWTRSTGAGVTVAVVDTGIDLHHEDLPADRLLVVPGANILDRSQPPQDDNGHGTHVAGIIGAEVGNGRGVVGVAPGATLMPVKVLSASGFVVGNAIDDGIRFAADHGARVINVSASSALAQPVMGPGFESALEYAWSKGAVPVVAAGNNGGALGSGYTSGTHALVVSASERHDAPASYSSPSNDAMWGIAAPGGGDPNLVPPEDTVFSTYWEDGKTNQYAYDAGTSMAAPHVAGAVADLLALGLTPQQAVDRVRATAKPGPPSFGAGRLDVAAAVGASPAASAGAGTGTGTGASGSGSASGGADAPGTAGGAPASRGAALSPTGDTAGSTGTADTGAGVAPAAVASPAAAGASASRGTRPSSARGSTPSANRSSQRAPLPIALAAVLVLAAGALLARRVSRWRSG